MSQLNYSYLNSLLEAFVSIAGIRELLCTLGPVSLYRNRIHSSTQTPTSPISSLLASTTCGRIAFLPPIQNDNSRPLFFMWKGVCVCLDYE